MIPLTRQASMALSRIRSGEANFHPNVQSKHRGWYRPQRGLAKLNFRTRFECWVAAAETIALPGRSLRTSASFLHPEDIDIIGAVLGPITHEIQVLFLDRRTSTRIQPFLDFGMAIGKGEAAGTVVIAGGNIDDLPGTRLVWIPRHIDDEKAVIDAVFTFIQKNDRARRAWIHDIGTFPI